MTDYNDGKWHGWNGGECPVHPDSVVEVVFDDGLPHLSRIAKSANGYCWGPVSTIIAFRVVKPYIEPQEYSGECYAYHYTSMAPSLAEYLTDRTIKGRWTATHINGKLAKITWDAIE